MLIHLRPAFVATAHMYVSASHSCEPCYQTFTTQPTLSDPTCTLPPVMAEGSDPRSQIADFLSSAGERGCRFASKSAAIAIYTLGGFSLLGTVGVDTKPLVAGLGVGGFTVGFALRVRLRSALLELLFVPFFLGILCVQAIACVNMSLCDDPDRSGLLRKQVCDDARGLRPDAM